MFRRSLSAIQRDNFGRINEEEDRSFQRIRQNRKGEPAQSLGNISAGVGRNQPNTRADVARVETLMERNDSFDLSGTEGPTGLFSIGLDSAIRDFQGARDLKQDGLIFPRGETVSALVETASQFSDSSGLFDFSFDDEEDPAPSQRQPFAENDDDDDDEPDCEEEEVAWVNAEAALFIARQNLESAQEEIKGYEQQIQNTDNEIKEKKEELEDTEGKIRGGSVATGTIIGGLIGGFAFKNPAGIAKGAEKGGSAGMKVAENLIRLLQLQISLLEKEKDELLKKTEDQSARVASLKEEASRAQAAVDEAKQTLINCREGNKYKGLK